MAVEMKSDHPELATDCNVKLGQAEDDSQVNAGQPQLDSKIKSDEQQVEIQEKSEDIQEDFQVKTDQPQDSQIKSEEPEQDRQDKSDEPELDAQEKLDQTQPDSEVKPDEAQKETQIIAEKSEQELQVKSDHEEQGCYLWRTIARLLRCHTTTSSDDSIIQDGSSKSKEKRNPLGLYTRKKSKKSESKEELDLYPSDDDLFGKQWYGYSRKLSKKSKKVANLDIIGEVKVVDNTAMKAKLGVRQKEKRAPSSGHLKRMISHDVFADSAVELEIPANKDTAADSEALKPIPEVLAEDTAPGENVAIEVTMKPQDVPMTQKSTSQSTEKSCESEHRLDTQQKNSDEIKGTQTKEETGDISKMAAEEKDTTPPKTSEKEDNTPSVVGSKEKPAADESCATSKVEKSVSSGEAGAPNEKQLGKEDQEKDAAVKTQLPSTDTSAKLSPKIPDAITGNSDLGDNSGKLPKAAEEQVVTNENENSITTGNGSLLPDDSRPGEEKAGLKTVITERNGPLENKDTSVKDEVFKTSVHPVEQLGKAASEDGKNSTEIHL